MTKKREKRRHTQFSVTAHFRRLILLEKEEGCNSIHSYLFLKQVRIPDSESSKTQFGLISDELQKQLRDILQSDDTKEDNKVFQQAR